MMTLASVMLAQRRIWLLNLISRSPSDWEAAIRGETLLGCVSVIVIISAPILTETLWVMRKGSVGDPFRWGLLAGLLAGAAAVLIYSMYCIKDDPAF